MVVRRRAASGRTAVGRQWWVPPARPAAANSGGEGREPTSRPHHSGR